MLQELSVEQEQLADFERILKKDTQMGDEAYKVRAQLESHKVREDENHVCYDFLIYLFTVAFFLVGWRRGGGISSHG